MLTVKQAFSLFASKSDLARFLNISRQAVSHWQEQNYVLKKYQQPLLKYQQQREIMPNDDENNHVIKGVNKSAKILNVDYVIRGTIQETATRMEEEGYNILKLNIGNPSAFGVHAPEEVLQDVIHNLKLAEPYTESRGLFSARKAIMQECQLRQFPPLNINNIYIGNGVSELIVMCLQGLLNDGDEVLVPAPNYPLWASAVHLCGGHPAYYVCDETNEWQPDLDDMRKKITPSTRAITVINPNNPTGAVYTQSTLQGIIELAREYNLIIFADEIYDKILFDDAQHIPLATLDSDVMVATFGGLSKNYRLAGFRCGWVIFSGRKLNRAKQYLAGIDMLASIRLCANVPGQLAVQTALGGYQSIKDLVAVDGRLTKQRDFMYRQLMEIPGISCVKPKGAIYLYPKLDNRFAINSDEKMVLDLLKQQRILVVHGSGFHSSDQAHFRLTFLPDQETLNMASQRLQKFFAHYRQIEA